MLGGTKADDSIKVIEHVLAKGSADKVLVSGLVANIFLAAGGIDLGPPNLEYIRSSGYGNYIEICKRLLDNYDGKIVTPLDVALNDNGKRLETSISALPKAYPIYDIGIETIVAYSTELKTTDNVEIKKHTDETLKAAAQSKFSILGGGHIAAAARNIGIDKHITHISTGGGACINFLAGETLPGIQALVEASAFE